MMQDENNLVLRQLLTLIESGKMTEIEAERLLNSYTRTLTKTPTHDNSR